MSASAALQVLYDPEAKNGERLSIGEWDEEDAKIDVEIEDEDEEEEG